MTKRKDLFEFKPQFAVHPGVTLEEVIAEKGITQKELALRLNRTPKFVNEIINGKAPITPETALMLEMVLGVPAEVWINLQNGYDIAMARLKEENVLKSELYDLPEDMIKTVEKLGWVSKSNSSVGSVKNLLSYLNIVSINQLPVVYKDVELLSEKNKNDPKWALWAYLWYKRSSDTLAQGNNTVKRSELRKFLQEVNKQMLCDVFFGIHDLQERLRQVGVTLIVAESLPKIKGISAIIGSEDSCSIIMSEGENSSKLTMSIISLCSDYLKSHKKFVKIYDYSALTTQIKNRTQHSVGN